MKNNIKEMIERDIVAIETAMHEQGIVASALAKSINVAPSTITGWLNRKTIPRPYNLRDAKKHLRIQAGGTQSTSTQNLTPQTNKQP